MTPGEDSWPLNPKARPPEPNAVTSFVKLSGHFHLLTTRAREPFAPRRVNLRKEKIDPAAHPEPLTPDPADHVEGSARLAGDSLGLLPIGGFEAHDNPGG